MTESFFTLEKVYDDGQVFAQSCFLGTPQMGLLQPRYQGSDSARGLAIVVKFFVFVIQTNIKVVVDSASDDHHDSLCILRVV